MEYKPSNSELVINRNVRFDQLPSEFQEFVISYEQIEILGVPIGGDDYVNEKVILKLIGALDK